MKLFVIRCLDWLDTFVLRHRSTVVCRLVAESGWWDSAWYLCKKCGYVVTDGFNGHGCPNDEEP